MTRRTLLTALLAAAQPGEKFRYAVCNETFQGTQFPEQCRLARQTGYTGMEIMPATLTEDPAALPVSRRAEVRRTIQEEGLSFVGLHNLLSAPAGLHATTANPATYRRTWDLLRSLTSLCGDLGGGVMVFGSGKQRNAEAGMARADAMARLTEGFAGLSEHARAHQVTILIEPLAPHLCNLVNTLAEATAIVQKIGSPAVQTMFDVHNTAGETLSTPELVSKYRDRIRHVHLNEMDGKRPGLGSYDFGALLRALAASHYQGWLSLEVFDFTPSGTAVAEQARKFLASIEGG